MMMHCTTAKLVEKFKIGDRVRFRYRSGWPHSGTVTALGKAVTPDNFDLYATAQVKWDVPSIMYTSDLYWDVDVLEISE
jgi:hypothetical protein